MRRCFHFTITHRLHLEIVLRLILIFSDSVLLDLTVLRQKMRNKEKEMREFVFLVHQNYIPGILFINLFLYLTRKASVRYNYSNNFFFKGVLAKKGSKSNELLTNNIRQKTQIYNN